MAEDAEAGGLRDPGLQKERTALAWQRTGVSGSAVGALVVLVAAHTGSLLLVVATAVLAGAAAAAAGLAARSGGSAAAAARTAGTGGQSPWTRLLATASVPVVVAVAGMAVALAPYPR